MTWDDEVAWDLSASGARMRVRLDVGGTKKGADLVTDGAQSGTARSLAFRYEVVRSDRDADGVHPTPSADGSMVVLSGSATLTGAAGQDAGRAHAALAADRNHRVNGSLDASGVPAVESAAIVSDPGPHGVYGLGESATVALGSAVAWGETLAVGYAAPGSDPVRDLAGNAAADFANAAAANKTARANRPATGAPTVSGTAQVGETLTASAAEIADADGLEGAEFAWQWTGEHGDIAGATGASYTLVDADVGVAIQVRASFTDDAGNSEELTSAATAPVELRPLTAEFQGMPAEHDGSRLFSFELVFSENFAGRFDYKTLRDSAFTVTGGRVRGAERVVKSENRRWKITVRPSSNDDVSITLAAGSVSTESGRPLANTVSARVAGPVGVSVADARVKEGAGAVLAFAVTLSRAATSGFTVDYATSDCTAQAGADYTAASGTLSFQAGDSAGTIEVAVLDDAHDEGRRR